MDFGFIKAWVWILGRVYMRHKAPTLQMVGAPCCPRYEQNDVYLIRIGTVQNKKFYSVVFGSKDNTYPAQRQIGNAVFWEEFTCISRPGILSGVLLRHL